MLKLWQNTVKRLCQKKVYLMTKLNPEPKPSFSHHLGQETGV
jgi:hypothetical protein